MYVNITLQFYFSLQIVNTVEFGNKVKIVWANNQ